jgi:hypothetical protein
VVTLIKLAKNEFVILSKRFLRSEEPALRERKRPKGRVWLAALSNHRSRVM